MIIAEWAERNRNTLGFCKQIPILDSKNVVDVYDQGLMNGSLPDRFDLAQHRL